MTDIDGQTIGRSDWPQRLPNNDSYNDSYND